MVLPSVQGLTMRAFHSALLLAVISVAACRGASNFAGEDLLRSSTQHVLVVVESRGDSTGWMYRYAATGGSWAAAGDAVPVSVGAGGVGKEREGDKRAPTGAYPLTSVFGYAEAAPAGLKMAYLPLRPETECVDDADSRFYNKVVNPSDVGGRSWNSSEMMRRDLHNQDDLYKLGVLVNYNPSGAREAKSGQGAGSCIFLHIWRGPGRPTVGCTAMPEESMTSLVAWLDPKAHPLLIQGTREELSALSKAGALPYPVPPRRI
jgi:L,D-peptidoglycan transpeptidase YkuD (ErfK/YbiS/YcfS/YnhG family)